MTREAWSKYPDRKYSSPKLPDYPGAISVFGNSEIIHRHKTAFLCSRTYPAGAVLPVYDWAREVRDAGACVISGFHSGLERDVLDILLRGGQPLILAVARGLPRRYSAAVKNAVDDGRLLVVSPFPVSVVRITADTARRRNEFIAAVAERIVVGHMSGGGGLGDVVAGVAPGKEVVRLSGG